jgi:CHAT domain-containing protein
MSLRLDADLVILSACNTGGADGRPRAEWMSGLARGFIAAGARQLLVTLWSIPSEPTVRLTTGMTAAYAAEPGLGWPRALQRSIVSMLESPASPIEAHPASWASFTVLGVDALRR